MKNKLILVLAIMLVMSISIAQAAVPEKKQNAIAKHPETTYLKSIKKMIRKSLVYPSFAKAENFEGDVWVKVNVDPNGNLKVVESNSMHKLLESYTRIKIEGLKTEMTGQSADLYLRISYKML